jgi:hypothetical protein
MTSFDEGQFYIKKAEAESQATASSLSPKSRLWIPESGIILDFNQSQDNI